MICSKCDLDLAKCTCPDLEERFRALQKSPYLSIGIEYQCLILAHIEELKKHDKHKSPETLKEALGVALEALCWIAEHGNSKDSARAMLAYNSSITILNDYPDPKQPARPAA